MNVDALLKICESILMLSIALLITVVTIFILVEFIFNKQDWR